MCDFGICFLEEEVNHVDCSTCLALAPHLCGGGAGAVAADSVFQHFFSALLTFYRKFLLSQLFNCMRPVKRAPRSVREKRPGTVVVEPASLQV